MSDRWYYRHDDQTHGPLTAAQLRQLAAAGQLLPADLIWPEGRDQGQAVEASAAVDFGAQAGPVENKPDWLNDVRAAGVEKPVAAPATPDWLDDVRAAEEEMVPIVAELEEVVETEAQAQTQDEDLKMLKLLDELNKTSDSKPRTKSRPETVDAIGPSCRFVIGTATTRGRVRKHNEDSLLVQQCTWYNLDDRYNIALIVVADGMGGHRAGERASGLVIRTMSNVLSPFLTAALDGQVTEPTAADLGEALDNSLREANRIIRETAKDNPAYKGMGSTAVALLLWNELACISSVGDCRVYHWRSGRLTQVTRDQTLVARMVELGQLTPQEAATHPRRNEVSQAIGKFHLIEPARHELSLKAGDWLVACCDGLQAHVADPAIHNSIGKGKQSAITLANQLVELANRGGGSDNCTVATVHCL